MHRIDRNFNLNQIKLFGSHYRQRLLETKFLIVLKKEFSVLRYEYSIVYTDGEVSAHPPYMGRNTVHLIMHCTFGTY